MTPASRAGPRTFAPVMRANSRAEPVWCPWVRRISLRKRRAREPLQRRVTTDPGVGQHCGQVESNPPVNVRAAGRPAQLDQST